MRAYRFPQTEAERMTVISRFGGVDFRTHPTTVLPVSYKHLDVYKRQT